MYSVFRSCYHGQLVGSFSADISISDHSIGVVTKVSTISLNSKLNFFLDHVLQIEGYSLSNKFKGAIRCSRGDKGI